MNMIQWTLPSGLLMHAGLNPHFIAVFCLFVAVMLAWTFVCSIVLQKTVRLPLVAGYIVAGIILGPSVINIAQWPLFASPLLLTDIVSHQSYAIISSDLFIFFVLLISGSLTVAYLLWLAGYETHIEEIAQVGIPAVTAGILGAVLPIIIIGAALYFFAGNSWTLAQAVGMGVIFSATSVSIPIAMLFASNRMHLRSSKATLGAAIIDDILAVILLSLFFIILETGALGIIGELQNTHTHSLWYSLTAMVITAVVLYIIGYYSLPMLMQWLTTLGHGQAISLCAIIVMLFYFAGAELLGGFAGITGAYLAGYLFKRADSRHYAHKMLTPFVQSVLLPLFLGSIGLQINITLLSSPDWLMVAGLLILAIISKLIGCYIATWLSNIVGNTEIPWSNLESYLFGSSMVARGEVGLVIATVLYGLQLLTPIQYIIGIIVIVLTTIASPIMLAIGFAQENIEKMQEKIQLGRFELFGTVAVFNAMVADLEKKGVIFTTLEGADGSKVVDVLQKNIKILLDPSKGILIEGNKSQISELLGGIFEDLEEEIRNLEPLN